MSPSPRNVLSVWLRRRWMFVWAWRLLVFPFVSDVRRDPALRGAVLADHGKTCACCRRSDAGPTRPPGGGLRFEVDHKRPLWASGADSARNAQVLCSVCHVFKSRAEAPVRAVVKRWHKRLDILHHRPSPVLSVFGALFLAGVVTTRWVVFCLLALCVLWFGPPLWRKYRPSFTGRSMGGGGFNRQPDFDRILEERQAGVTGRVSRGYWWWRRFFFSARYVPMAAMVTYLAGVYVRHYGDETALALVRVLL